MFFRVCTYTGARGLLSWTSPDSCAAIGCPEFLRTGAGPAGHQVSAAVDIDDHKLAARIPGARQVVLILPYDEPLPDVAPDFCAANWMGARATLRQAGGLFVSGRSAMPDASKSVPSIWAEGEEAAGPRVRADLGATDLQLTGRLPNPFTRALRKDDTHKSRSVNIFFYGLLDR